MVDIVIREGGETLPLLIRPSAGTEGEGDRSAGFLKEWVRANRALIDQKLLQYGECYCV